MIILCKGGLALCYKCILKSRFDASIMRAFPLSAYSPGGVVLNVFLDVFISGALVNLGNGYDPDLVVQCFGFLGNRFIHLNTCKLKKITLT